MVPAVPGWDGRSGLTWRGRFQDVAQLTQLYNFYSSGEEVLENRNDDSDPWITDIASLQLRLPVFKLPVNWLVGRYAWALQEVLKGRVTESDFDGFFASTYRIGGKGVALALDLAGLRAGNLMGSKYGGWGFNSYWDIGGSIFTIDGGAAPIPVYIPEGHQPPAAAVGIADGVLWAIHFSCHFSTRDSQHRQVDRWQRNYANNCWRKPSRQGRLQQGRIDWQTIRTLKLVKPVST